VDQSGELAAGQLRLVPLTGDQTVRVVIEPAKGFDMGEGSGRRVERQVQSGTVGLILDARGRPLDVPTDRSISAELVRAWAAQFEKG